MSRSLKKGPFIDEHLLKKVQQMNESNAKKRIREIHYVSQMLRVCPRRPVCSCGQVVVRIVPHDTRSRRL